MERLKKDRALLRRHFTNASKDLEVLLGQADANLTDLKVSFEYFSTKADKLFIAEDAIRDEYLGSECDIDEIETDANGGESYRLLFIKLRVRYEDRLPKDVHVSPGSKYDSVSMCSHGNKKNFKLPKLELIKFDGNVKNWLGFWGMFKKIHDDDNIDRDDKFQYLLQSMEPGSTARALIESFPPSGDNFMEAIEQLKARYARDELLIEIYVRELLAIVLNQAKGNAMSVGTLYDRLRSQLRALENLGVTSEKYAAMLYPLVESALPTELLRIWERSQESSKKNQTDTLNNLLNFLKTEVESEERIKLARQGFNEMTCSMEPKPPTACFVSESKAENPKKSAPSTSFCIWCSKEYHASSECNKASRMTLQERLEYLKQKRACTICLRCNHTAKKCKSFPKCLFCKKRHFTILCTDLAEQGFNKQNTGQEEKCETLLCQMKSTTLLQTLAVKIVHCGKEVYARALIDSGSQRSYIKKDLIQKLELKSSGKERISHCLFGGRETCTEEYRVFDVCVKNIGTSFNMHLMAVEQDNLCSFLPKIRSDVITEQLRDKGIILTDTTDTPDDVTILIGADFSGLLMTGNILQLGNNLTAIETKLGWTIQGPVTGVYSSIVNMTTTLHCLSKIELSDLWSLETLGISDPGERMSRTAREKEILESFNNSVKINEENRYEANLPWRENMPRPQPNFEVAKKRLMSTTSRLETLGKMSDYDAVFKEWQNLNIIERAPNENRDSGLYIPHHAVIKESSQTTKIRPVFDASFKDANGISLNSCLEKGINLIELIPDLLINFRKEAIGVTADVAKAFLQISLAPEDRDYLKFLWWSDVDGEDKTLVTYRHRRVVFGVTSSPFHLAATIAYHLDKSPEQLRDTALKLKKSFYVDNCVTSINSLESMNKFKKEAKEVMLNGMFDLRCWVTGPEQTEGQNETISVLGVVWNTKEDVLSCGISSSKNIEAKVTKRNLLSITQKIFDPIGVCSPTTIIPKIIMQQAWVRKSTWDQELPMELAQNFKNWMKDIHLISEVKIPRRLTHYDIGNCQNMIHVFCDASQHAYATCIFLRSEYQKNVNVSLIMAKSRVTPIKHITIPRLELIAATLASRLSLTVIQSLNLPNCPVYYWTDSSVVLSWIQGEGDWTVFVANRVREIRSSTSKNAWRHVPGHLNPADLPSRGVNAKGLLESRWWDGPSWLLLAAEDWPATDFSVDTNQIDDERRRTATQAMLVVEDVFLTRLAYFSAYTKIIRMVGWMMRWRQRSKRLYKELTYDEIEYAEKTVVRLIQTKHHQTITKLLTFKDDDGILRLETKLNLGNESFNFKSPIILPAREEIVQRLVKERHIILQHAGTQTLMTNLRETYWIIGIRKLVKRVIRDCVKCRRFKAKPCQTSMASLPKDRIEANSAFEVSGVDLAGPLLLKSGSKAWIVLFTCATYRAVHLEVVESLSTSEFILSLRRFIARRGRVKVIYSDNATNFTGLNNALNSLDWNGILCFSNITRIKWIFIPPAAPWWGGFYERLIGLVKQLLKRVLGRASLTLSELHTVLCDCEATINGRPLTYVSNYQDDPKPLTPSMFTNPLPGNGSTEDLDEIDNKSLNNRVKYCQKLREDLRQRFRNEYVSALIQTQRQRKASCLRVGDVVLMETDRKRISWPLAVVVDIYAGTDGLDRVARIRTAAGYKVRPFQRLFPLEIHYDFGDGTVTSDTMIDQSTEAPPASRRTCRLPERFRDFVM